MRLPIILVFILTLFRTPSFAQSIQQAIEKHDAEVETARKVVLDKWQALLTEALTKNEQARAGEYREWSDMFRNEGALFMPAKDPEMASTYRDYGAAIKKAGDDLRAAYLAEIERLRTAGNTDDADILLSELTERRLPGKLQSIQPYRSQNYFNHFGYTLRSTPIKASGEKMNGTFELTSGLSNSGLLSIRPSNLPTMFVSHHGFRVNLSAEIQDPVGKVHATWLQLPGLIDEKRGVSFQSVSHPDRYIRIRSNGEAWLDKFDESPQFRRESTFYFRAPQFALWPAN